MKAQLFAVTLGLLLGFYSQSGQSEEKMPNVVLLGDSIRMGYQAEVVKSLAGKAEVWAPEDNCQSSDFMLKNLDRWLAGKTPDVIFFNCGLHDIFLNEAGQARHTVEQYADFLRQIYVKLKTGRDKTTIIFALTTPVDEARQKTSKTYGRLVRRNSDVELINQKAAEVARDYGATVCDLHQPIQETGVEHLLVDDGIHLNPQGAQKLGAVVAQTCLAVVSKR